MRLLSAEWAEGAGTAGGRSSVPEGARRRAGAWARRGARRRAGGMGADAGVGQRRTRGVAQAQGRQRERTE
jgi:hypothetical protein